MKLVKVNKSHRTGCQVLYFFVSDYDAAIDHCVERKIEEILDKRHSDYSYTFAIENDVKIVSEEAEKEIKLLNRRVESIQLEIEELNKLKTTTPTNQYGLWTQNKNT